MVQTSLLASKKKKVGFLTACAVVGQDGKERAGA